jgi:WD40 repeat protein
MSANVCLNKLLAFGLLLVLANIGRTGSGSWESAWQELDGTDARKAYQAMQRFASKPDEAVRFFDAKLPSAPVQDANALQRWIAELESSDFAKRNQANLELEKRLDDALPHLTKTLQEKKSLEFRRRVETLLCKAAEPVDRLEHLRALRILEVLEELPTPAAGQLLKRLAGGNPQHRLTIEAQRSVKHWTGQQAIRQQKEWPALVLPKTPKAIWGDDVFRQRIYLRDARISNDGQTLMTIMQDAVCIWRIKDGKLLKQHPGKWNGRCLFEAVTQNDQSFMSWVRDKVFVFDSTTGERTEREVRNELLPEAWQDHAMLSPNGRFLLLGDQKDWEEGKEKIVLRIWDLETGKLHGKISRPYRSAFPIFSQSKNNEVLIYWDTGLFEWVDLALGKSRRTWEVPKELHNAFSVTLSPKLTYYVSCDLDGTIHRFDFKTGKKQASLSFERKGVRSFVLSPDDKYIAVSRSEAIVVYDAANFREIQRFSHIQKTSFNRLEFSPNSKILYTAPGHSYPYHRPRLWDLASGKELHPPSGHLARPTAVVFSADAQSVISVAGTEFLKWNVNTGKSQPIPFEAAKNIHVEAWSNLCWNEAGTKLLLDGYGYTDVFDRRLPRGILDLTTGKSNLWLGVPFYDVNRFVSRSPHSCLQSRNLYPWQETILTWTWDKDELNLHNAADGKVLRTFYASKEWNPMGEPHGYAIASTGKSIAVIVPKKNDKAPRLYLYETASGAIRDVQVPSIKAQSAVIPLFSPVKPYLALVTYNQLWIWDYQRQKVVQHWKVEEGDLLPMTAQFSNHGRVLAVQTHNRDIYNLDCHLRLWDLNTGRPLGRVTGDCSCFAFAPDGHSLLTGSNDTRIYWWSLLAP